MNIKKTTFGYLDNGKETQLFSMKNKQDTTLKITNFGGIISSLLFKDTYGNLRDTVLGFDTIQSYQLKHPYFGAIIGRYANRIAGSEFLLNGKAYTLFANNGKNHLHGGLKGFDKVIWNAEIFDNSLELSYFSLDGEEGYPGNLKVKVRYTLTEANEIIINYEALSDKDTFINLTNHSYFNLNGEGSGNILDHQLTLNASYYLPTNPESIPLGEIRPVKGTAFDFTHKKHIGKNIKNPDPQLEYTKGYDHNFIINKTSNDGMNLAASLESKESGIKMDVLTSEPGVQLYTGNYLDGSLTGKSGKYGTHAGLCLETQHFPDSPHFPDFPTTILKKDELFSSTTVYKFYQGIF